MGGTVFSGAAEICSLPPPCRSWGLAGHEDWRQVSLLTETSLAQVSDRFLRVDFLRRFIHFSVLKLSEWGRNEGMRVFGQSPISPDFRVSLL